MLEKMGWSQGKGLGVKEDGVREHVSLGFRTALQGLGWQEKDNNPQLNADYEQALANLHKRHTSASQPAVTVKTEETAATCQPVVKRDIRIRHRYGKVLRAKDTSSYSRDDMAKIFAVSVREYDTDTAPVPTTCDVPHSLGEEWRTPASSHETNERAECQPQASLPDDTEQTEAKKRKKKRNQRERREDCPQAVTSGEQDGGDGVPDCETRSKKRKKGKTEDSRVKREPEDSCDATLMPQHLHHADEEQGHVVGKRKRKSRKKEKEGCTGTDVEQ